MIEERKSRWLILIITLLACAVSNACTKQTGDTGRNNEAARCCSECRDAWAKSPAAIGAEGARCGRFMTAAKISDSCRSYFEKNPLTVSACEQLAGAK